mgnify:CR=1 FL=1
MNVSLNFNLKSSAAKHLGLSIYGSMELISSNHLSMNAIGWHPKQINGIWTSDNDKNVGGFWYHF